MMRDAFVTLGVALAVDQLLALCTRRIVEAEEAEQRRQGPLPRLTARDCEDILREIVETEFPYLTDLAQMVNDQNREILGPALVSRAEEIEAAVFAKQSFDLDGSRLREIIRTLDDDRLSLLCQEIRVMFETALNGSKAPTLPSILGYPENISEEDRDLTYEVIAKLNRQFRAEILNTVQADLTNCRDALPTASVEVETYALPPAIRDRVRRVLRDTQTQELAKLDLSLNLYLHNMALLANDPATANHLRILSRAHKQTLFESLLKLRESPPSDFPST